MNQSLPVVGRTCHQAPVTFRQLPASHQNQLVTPILHQFESALEQWRQQELRRFCKNLDAAEAQRLAQVTQALTEKIIHLSVRQLRAASQGGEIQRVISGLMCLFALPG